MNNRLTCLYEQRYPPARVAGQPDGSIVSITPIETLGFAGIGAAEETEIRRFLSGMISYALDDEVIENAIALRQSRSMKLGDAIIAATALEYGLPLITRNVDDFSHISGLQLINPFAGLDQP